jgi:hypothetical protein
MRMGMILGYTAASPTGEAARIRTRWTSFSCPRPTPRRGEPARFHRREDRAAASGGRFTLGIGVIRAPGERLDRRGAVTSPLLGDPYPLRAGELHRAGHVGSGLGEHDGNQPLVGEEVPRLARGRSRPRVGRKRLLRWRSAARVDGAEGYGRFVDTRGNGMRSHGTTGLAGVVSEVSRSTSSWPVPVPRTPWLVLVGVASGGWCRGRRAGPGRAGCGS